MSFLEANINAQLILKCSSQSFSTQLRTAAHQVNMTGTTRNLMPTPGYNMQDKTLLKWVVYGQIKQVNIFANSQTSSKCNKTRHNLASQLILRDEYTRQTKVQSLTQRLTCSLLYHKGVTNAQKPVWDVLLQPLFPLLFFSPTSMSFSFSLSRCLLRLLNPTQLPACGTRAISTTSFRQLSLPGMETSSSWCSNASACDSCVNTNNLVFIFYTSILDFSFFVNVFVDY